MDPDLVMITWVCNYTYIIFIQIKIHISILSCWGFPGGTVAKNLPADAGDARDETSIPGSGRSPGAGNGNPLRYFHLGNLMDRGAWQATVHAVTKAQHSRKYFMFIFINTLSFN